jgi:anti-anti-sigma factor
MKADLYLSAGRLLVSIEGRFVLDERESLKKSVLAALSPAVSHVLIDLSKTEFIDSAGLGVLVGIKIKSNQIKARMSLINPSTQVRDVLLMSRLDEIFETATGSEASTLVSSVASPESLVCTVGIMSRKSTPAEPPAELKIEEPRAPRQEAEAVDEQIEELCRQAAEALRRGDYDESVRFYRMGLEKNANYLPARNNLAIVYEKRPEWRQKAIDEWQTVLRLSEQLGDPKHRERAEKHLQALRGQGAK